MNQPEDRDLRAEYERHVQETRQRLDNFLASLVFAVALLGGLIGWLATRSYVAVLVSSVAALAGLIVIAGYSVYKFGPRKRK